MATLNNPIALNNRQYPISLQLHDGAKKISETWPKSNRGKKCQTQVNAIRKLETERNIFETMWKTRDKAYVTFAPRTDQRLK